MVDEFEFGRAPGVLVTGIDAVAGSLLTQAPPEITLMAIRPHFKIDIGRMAVAAVESGDACMRLVTPSCSVLRGK